MKVGDILVFKNVQKRVYNRYYTENKHYRIIKVDENFVPGTICGWIIDDEGGKVYFRDDDFDSNWVFLKDIRKEKLEKLNYI